MAGGWSTYLEAKLLDHVWGDTPFTAPTDTYVALSTAAFDRTATGSACSEVTAAGYARVHLVNNTTNYPNATGGAPASKQIGVDVVFPTLTADAGVVLSFYIMDASSAGNILGGGDAVAPYAAPSGSTPVIKAGTQNITEL